VFLIDLHTHTSYGSSCGYMTPTELVRRAKWIGLHGVCITDHNQVWDRDVIAKLGRDNDMVVIGGVEVSTDWGDILVYGLHRPVREVHEIEELRMMVDEAGGVMVAAHPFRGEFVAFGSPLEVAQVGTRHVFRYLDGLEVCNGLSGKTEREFSADVARSLDLAETGGSDAHAVLGLGRCFTICEDAIGGEEDLIAAIRERRCRGAVWDKALLKR
jgi:predicted metal-dependent phosphoesterase TrpH